MKIASAIACLGLMPFAHGEEPQEVQIQEAVQLDIVVDGEPIQVDLAQLKMGLNIQLRGRLNGERLEFGVDGAVPQTEAIPKKHADLKEVTMVIEDMQHRTDGLGYEVTFRIINPTKELMQFPGFSEKEPRTQKQLWRGDAWEDPKNVEHSSNIRIRKCRIAPGQSAVFKATFTIDEMPARIGVGYSNGHHNGKHMKVWSEKIGH